MILFCQTAIHFFVPSLEKEARAVDKLLYVDEYEWLTSMRSLLSQQL